MAARKFFISPAQLKQDYSAVGNIRILACRYGVDHNIVSKNMKRFGISFDNKVVGDVIDIERLLCQGWTSQKIAKYFSCTDVCVNQVIRKNGWKSNDSYHKKYVSTHNGYKKIKVGEDHPFADGKGYVMEHRLVTEDNIGRFLFPDEIVHHVDRNKRNNNISNLVIMSREEHIRLHWREGNPSLI